MRKMKNNYDFSAIGKAIKVAREEKGWTREQAAEMVDLVPRYLLALENEGKNPSGQVLVLSPIPPSIFMKSGRVTRSGYFSNSFS